MPVKSKSYWWKDKSGKWHYHKPGTEPARGYTETSTTKPSGVPDNVTPTKPTDGSSGTTQTKPVSSGAIRSAGSDNPVKSVDPGFYRPHKPSSGITRNAPLGDAGSGASRGSLGVAKGKDNYVPPGGGKAQAKADWKAGWQPKSKSSGDSSDKSGKPQKVSMASLSGKRGSSEGVSRKVYDDARAKVLSKKKKSFRP